MPLKDLTLDDILNDQIDERAFEAPTTGQPSGRQKRTDGKYRIRANEYNMLIEDTQMKEFPDGRRVVTLKGRLENSQGTYRGTVFADISWQFRTRKDGKLDLRSRLFQQLVAALGAPQGTPLPEFLEGIDQETVHVYVAEYFLVPFADLHPSDLDGAEDNGRLVKVYINDTDEDDAKANYYLDNDLRSRGEVLSITAVEG